MFQALSKSKVLRHTWRLLTAIFGGAVAGLALPRINQGYFIFLSVALILVAVRNRGFWTSYGLGFAAGVCFYASQATWMSAYLGPVPWLALATLEAFIFATGIAVISLVWTFLEHRIRKNNPYRLVIIATAIACMWVSREWFAANYPYGGYAWSRLAQTQADTVLARWAYWGGMSAISFSVAFLSAMSVLLVVHRRNRPWIALASMALVILIPTFTFISIDSAKTLTVASVQGNANAGLFANPEPGSILAKHLTATNLLMRDSKFDQVQVVVWPENASDIDPTSNPIAKEVVENLVDTRLKKPLVLGAVTYRGPDIYNSVLQFEPGKSVVDYYDKMRPVPFAEYVPDRPFWNSLAPDLIGLITHGFSFGTRDGILNVAGTKAGTLICFEITIDEVMHDLVSGGAQILFSQANNSDFGHTDETFQQETIARLQAIATGRSVVHVSTVGVTEMIYPDGTVSQVLPPFKRGYLIDTLPLKSDLTVAMRFYGWFDWMSNLATAAMLILAVFWRLRNQRNQT